MKKIDKYSPSSSTSQSTSNIDYLLDCHKKYQEELKNQSNINVVLACLFVVCLHTCIVLVFLHGYEDVREYIHAIVTSMFGLMIITPLLYDIQLKRVIKNHTQGKENEIINIELFLRNMFFSRYGKQLKKAEVIDEKIINYVLENLNEKNMSYREFLELNLDGKYTAIKDKYVQLKSKKDELNLLKD
jgi:hypothetical protein